MVTCELSRVGCCLRQRDPPPPPPPPMMNDELPNLADQSGAPKRGWKGGFVEPPNVDPMIPMMC